MFVVFLNSGELHCFAKRELKIVIIAQGDKREETKTREESRSMVTRPYQNSRRRRVPTRPVHLLYDKKGRLQERSQEILKGTEQIDLAVATYQTYHDLNRTCHSTSPSRRSTPSLHQLTSLTEWIRKHCRQENDLASRFATTNKLSVVIQSTQTNPLC